LPGRFAVSAPDWIDGQELVGVWFVLRQRRAVGAKGFEHLLSVTAKLLADFVPHKLTQICLASEHPTCSLLSHVSPNAMLIRGVIGGP
jgi:hypothetical protein